MNNKTMVFVTGTMYNFKIDLINDRIVIILIFYIDFIVEISYYHIVLMDR